MDPETNNSFRLIAYDPETAFSPRNVLLERFVRVGLRDDFVWATVDPPLSPVNATGESITRVLLGARHEGYSLKNTPQVPLHVYICKVDNMSLLRRTELDPETVSILYWALLLPSCDERDNVCEILESMAKTEGNVYHVNPVHK